MTFFFLLALLLTSLWVSLYDFRYARIPNWITLSLISIGVIVNSPHSLSVYVFIFAFWLAWRLGWMGAGDAKLWIGLILSLPLTSQRLWIIPLVFFSTGILQLLWRKIRGSTLTGIHTPGAWRTFFYLSAILIQEFQHAYGPISCPIG